MSTSLAMLAAVLLDAVLGEPRRGHPLVAFGRWAKAIETATYAGHRGAGLLAWALAVLPIGLLAALLARQAYAIAPWCDALFEIVLLYLALGLRSLGEHALPVARALEAGDLDAARGAVALLVSRDAPALDAGQVAAAATESVLENGNDAVFGALFWFALFGAPGAVVYRLANTLDAMWGYRTPRYRQFGWAAARLDDALNFLPARLTALTYALGGRTRAAWRCWRSQAAAWESPNAGPVMAAGAGALGVRLGGPAPYHGEVKMRPVLGEGAPADAGAIRRAVRLLRGGVAIWLAAMLALEAIIEVWAHA